MPGRNKEEAAAFLGISVRSLERYMTQGRVAVRYERSDKTRPKAMFDDEDLERFKAELETPTVRPPVPTEESAAPRQDLARHRQEDNDETGEGLSRIPPEKTAGVRQDSSAVVEALAEAIALVMERQATARPALPPDRKLLLTLKEAQALTGLSRQQLRAEIAAGNLEATKTGRGWKVKRSALERYVEQHY